ncbi:MAG: tRNA 2-thiocytidine biosynthesis protein TtcA [Lachnospiraceae bacterium]|nr:tRNA 2-thiocytidine biosynthesis protein TtcA [Lachnospiraceae bacterium]
MSRVLTPVQKIEQSIVKGYRSRLWTPFCRAINRYQLILPGDKIAVCISGGKDSMLMAKMMQLLHRYSEIPFDVIYLIMDPGYNEINRRKVESNAEFLEIPYTLFESDVFEVANVQDKNACYLCARMRRGCLYKKAQELGCNKIALGHHFDDVIGTTMLGMFYGGQLQAMLPKLKAKNFPGMELIRPMYLVHEEDIIAWKNANELTFIQCACRFTENCTLCDNGQGGSKRQEIKQLLKKLKKDNPRIEDNIFSSIHTLQLDTMVGWKYHGQEYSFLDSYDGTDDDC